MRSLLPLLGFVPLAFGLRASAAGEFPEEILPILEKHCFECHGPKKAKASLRLDVREAALAGGESGKAIVPGKSGASPLIERVISRDEEERMPPKGERLTPAEIAALRTWIDAGAVWPDGAGPKVADWREWWAFKPLTSPNVPRAAEHPVDAFIRDRVAQKGLAPAPEADRRTLARRLFFDLTGLPPTPEEVAAFVADADPQAYERLVDKLLASPRHGEHWGRHWLDVANYADTHGNDHDFARPNAWRYRDYVIRAFNEDKPYARFVQEQVAGDALFPDDPQATVALGFLAAGPWDHTLMVTVREDTVDHRMAQNLDRDAMVSAVMGTFQSLTVHCARCHDHKFDPISQREYYGLQAVFAGVDRADRPIDSDPRSKTERKRLLAEQRAVKERAPALLVTLDTPAVAQSVAAWEAARAKRDEAWTPFDVVSVVSAGGATLAQQPDGSWFASGTRPPRDTYTVTARWRAGPMSAVRLEALPDDRLPQRGPGRWENGNFHLSELRASAAPAGAREKATPLVFGRASADYDEGPTISAAQAIDGKPETQWGVHPRYGEPHEAVFELKTPTSFPEGTTFTLLLEFNAGAPGHGLGRFRLSASDATPTAAAPLAPVPEKIAAILRTPASERTLEQRHELALAVLAEANQRALAALPAPEMVYAVTRDFPPDGPNFKPSPQPRPIHLLVRGELSKPAELIAPGALGCVPPLAKELPITDPADESARRTALARWLTDERNVLTWRSIVNRIWHYHFGRGLCDTPNDFGKMGGIPSHPELLNWLAVWFRDEAKGSLKAMHKLLVTSATFRQATGNRAEDPDPENRLLARMQSRRLSAEEVRDSALQLSGKLNLEMGGPPAVQFGARGAATFMPADGSPPFLDYETFDPDSPQNQRRAIYRFLFRTVPDPFMDALDCPDGSALTPVRGVSTTAVQAFAMLNDPFLIRQCEHLAHRISATADTPEKQADSAIQLVLLRNAQAAERAKLAAYIGRYGLANACQLLLNSNEFLFVD